MKKKNCRKIENENIQVFYGNPLKSPFMLQLKNYG